MVNDPRSHRIWYPLRRYRWCHGKFGDNRDYCNGCCSARIHFCMVWFPTESNLFFPKSRETGTDTTQQVFDKTVKFECLFDAGTKKDLIFSINDLTGCFEASSDGQVVVVWEASFSHINRCDLSRNGLT